MKTGFVADLVIPATPKARRMNSLLRLAEDKDTLEQAQYFDSLQLSMFSRRFPYANDNSILASALPISVRTEQPCPICRVFLFVCVSVQHE